MVEWLLDDGFKRFRSYLIRRIQVKTRSMLAKAQMAVVLVVAFVSLSAFAAEKAGKPDVTSPHAVVEKVTNDMMEVIQTGGKALKENPEKYFSDIRATLESTVSFEFIAKNVMAKYWEQANEKQREQFVEAFTMGMVETLGKGMANYSELTIKTLPSDTDASSVQRMEVVQEVEAADGTSRISYTMAKNRSGEWKLINVVLNGVNLGKSYRDQFIQAMKQNDNNVDKVIADWAKQG